MHKIKQTFQQDSTDCGPVCIKMILFYYGKNIHLDDIREICYLSRDGVSFLSISEALVRFGFKTFGNKLSLFELKKENLLPCILHWNQNHFVVLHKIQKKSLLANTFFKLLTPLMEY